MYLARKEALIPNDIILNDMIFQVENIPFTFESEEHYFGSFVYPLLEEARSELASSMEIMHRAPFADMLSFNESTSGKNRAYDVIVGLWKNQYSERGRDGYNTLPGDLLLLVDGKPESISDLKHAGRTWDISMVKRKEDDSTSIRVHRNLDIIKEVLYSDSKVKEKCDICSFGYDNMLCQKLDPYLLLNLNESQKMAVREALCKMQCCHISSVEQIWGTPGRENIDSWCFAFHPFANKAKDSCVCFNEFGDLLLFGSKERLEVSTDIEEIHLKHRVKRIAECLGPVTDKRTMLEIKSFGAFVQERFNSLAPSLRRCILTFCTHILRNFMGESIFQNMISLLENISSLESLLFHKNLVSEELEDLFNSKDDFVKSREMSSMGSIRAISLSVLRTLQISLEGLAFPCFSNKYAIKQFYFQTASVIFCTTSSSYKLHAVNMEPLNILVIDEAAQLKEAESTIPLQLPGMKHTIFIRDERQLPAMVNNNVKKLTHKYEKLDGFSVKVKSIDGFQGGEEDIIILSKVRSNIHGSLGFISSPQRTNVALTRARHCLWILGNERTLTNSESIWKDLVSDARNRHCFFDVDADECLKMTIIGTKKELEQLDDLVNGNSVLFEHAKWKVLFSDDFRRSFGKLTRPRLKKQVEGIYVICTIDIIKEVNYTQVLKVWNILPLEEIPELTKRLGSIFSAYSDDYINRCTEKCFEGNLEVPKSWPASQKIIRFRYISDCDQSEVSVNPGNARSYVENSKVSESLLLMKFYSLSRGVVSHLLSGDEVDLPMQVTDEQMDIILSGKSSFIIGRSGTGKTTILTMKLFQHEQKFRIASNGIHEAESSRIRDGEVDDPEISKLSVLRQLFVTVSPKLCYAVKQNVSHLTSSSSREINLDNTDVIPSVFDDIPDTFINIPVKHYPLVITFQKFLIMLDGTLGRSFFERFLKAREGSNGNHISSRSIALQTFIRLRDVTFDRFCSLYWPHFNTNLTKQLDSSRVFTEIISHIKGGLKAGECSDGKLSYEGYCLLAESRSSTLSKEKREIVYTLFETYEKMKSERGEFDLGDLVNDIHHRLKNGSYEGDQMDLVYIDEVQDLSMRQISLFKYICRNVEEGFMFAGDTAQTIARGIDFRFQDIRSLFYKEFLSTRTSGEQHKGLVSDIKQLKENFKTHAGVLDLAQSVINILYHYYIHSVDKLEPKISLIFGESHVLLESGDDENAIVTIFGGSGRGSDEDIVGFGAEQVILVRDDHAKTEVCEYVGKNSLVLTIVECKGLEFHDVLLYNFFGTSPLKDQWRVIYEYMKKYDWLEDKLPQSFPAFNEARHSVLCSELKQLYVAITRTRQRLWICENKEKLSKPMFDYWKKRGLVQIKKLDDSVAQAMRVASSPQEWRERGKKFFYGNNFVMATMCFERAGDTMWEKLAKASGLRASAYQMRGTNHEAFEGYLREAALMFESIGKLELSATCYCDLGEYEKAGKIYMHKCGKFKAAAECFTIANLQTHFGLTSIKPALELSKLEALSVYSFHIFSDFDSSYVVFLAFVSLFSSKGVSTRKSANICHLTELHPLNLMSCSPNSIAHLAIRLDFSGLVRICFNGLSVSIQMRMVLMLSIEAARYISKASRLIEAVTVGNVFMNSFIFWKASSTSAVH
ncbi:UvrD-like helicase, ATP-binding domain, P-loop containing nucleoside triphosphate hydrolase [Tanacetum coccineum]|uniref:UvrD-like helicase, ATP-binding domain, P-loop containing nucleoside triphosphate hydrolase n=1 Tax=Tanacetum coccineum TaxID=301880 RepID=A0ABQ5GN55_9ASTR